MACKYNCGREASHEHLLLVKNGVIVPDDEFEVKNSRALPGGWSQQELWTVPKRIGFVENGEIDIIQEGRDLGYGTEDYKYEGV